VRTHCTWCGYDFKATYRVRCPSCKSANVREVSKIPVPKDKP
jgi:predicted Zn-ribbon and HTH transcriptional regulator